MSHNLHVQKRQEKFFKLAKQQGYRSRAAFKLIQLNKKYNFLSTARAAIDLCAAPGGWLQILSKYMPVSSLIIGVDILPIKQLPNVITFQEDITTQTCRAKLKKQLQGWQVDLVVHDGAPNVGGGGTWTKDSYVQNELVLHACKLACEFLSEGGTFVTKIFRSEDYMALTWVLKQFFKKVEVTKPVATREQSAEIFAVCTGYLAPKKIDPRIFDANYIFKLHREQHGDNSTSKVLNVLNMKVKGRPGRDGYDDDQSLVHNKVATVSQFLSDVDPNKVLAYFNQVEWDSEAQWAKEHELTTPEISHLFDDLKVLSKGDFTRLIRWHKKVRAWKNIQDDIANGALDGDENDDSDLELTTEQLLANQQAAEEAELDALLQMREQHDKRLRKKIHEKKMKELNRLALNANNMAEPIYDEEEDELFRLNKIKTAEDLKLFKQAGRDFSKAGLDRATYEEIISTRPSDAGSDLEENEKMVEEQQKEWEALSYDEQRARQIDTLYDQYKKRKNIITKRDMKQQAKVGPDGGALITNGDESDDLETKADLDVSKKRYISMNDDSDSDSNDDPRQTKTSKKSDKNITAVEKYLKDTHSTNNLFKKGEKETNFDQANRWFSQDIFTEIDLDNDEERKLLTKHQKELEKVRQQRLAAMKRREEYFNQRGAEDDEEEDATPRGPTKRKQPSGGHKFDVNNTKQSLDGDEAESEDFYNSSDAFTETDSEDSDDADKDYDPNTPFSSKKSRWAGTLEDRERDLQKKIDMAAQAEEYLFKQEQINKAEMEVVPAQEEWTEYSDDSDARAEVIALGQKMIRKRSKNALIDATYNKYTWNDREQLPEWFAEDEAQHNVPQKPITKAEVMAVKNYYKAIDARPMQKVAEAKGRKKRGEMRRLERQKIHADNIMNQEGVSTEQKMKQLEKMHKKKMTTTKITKQYVMAAKNGKTTATKVAKGTKGKVWTVRVDARMKKEKQGAQRAEWRKKNGNRKRN